jgi:hypothetical protein
MANEEGSIQHAGDKVNGSNSSEHIMVDLQRVSPKVKIIAFVVNSFSGVFDGVETCSTDSHFCTGLKHFNQTTCDAYVQLQKANREKGAKEEDLSAVEKMEEDDNSELDEKASVSYQGADVVEREHNSVLVCKLYRALSSVKAGDGGDKDPDAIKKKRWVWMMKIKPVSGDGSNLRKLLSMVTRNLGDVLPELKKRNMPYQDVADICSVLSGQYLQTLSKTYPAEGLAVKPFIRLMMRTIGILNPPALSAMINDSSVALQMVALLFDLFSQIDVDGNEVCYRFEMNQNRGVDVLR